MKSMVYTAATIAAFLSGSAIAGTMGTPAPDPWAQVMALSVGPAWNQSYDNQSFFVQPEIERTYTSTNGNEILVAGEFFYGVQYAINPTILGQIGLAVAATSNAKISGEVWDDALPEFNNFSYSYRVNHTRVAVKGELLAEMGYMVTPYLNGSVGVGFNHAHGFLNVPLIFEAVATPNFVSHTETTFSYTVGAGIQRAIDPNWQVGVGYEFADWGKNQLGLAPDQTLGHGILHDHLYTNGVMFNLTYLA